ncbi:hypothetical protein IFT82_14225 [Sphingomonas sp. CFBP 8760]|nr:hypothetical protein [Sphingomonas sp. CFBP 8760]
MPSINIPISIDATGADPASAMRAEQAVDQLRGELPGIILSVLTEAKARRII